MTRGTCLLVWLALSLGCAVEVADTTGVDVALTGDDTSFAVAPFVVAPFCDSGTDDDVGPVRFYRVTKDLRECAAPFCGGHFLSAVNVDATLCHDGLMRDACYVAKLEMPNGLTPQDGDLLEGDFAVEKGKAPAHSVGQFFARRHFVGTLLGGDDGEALYRVVAPNCDGPGCWPTAQALNHGRTTRAWVGFAGAACDVRDTLRASFEQRFERDGESIVAARGWPMFGMTWLVVDNVMLPRQSIREPAGEGAFCGGIAAFPCAAGLRCVLDGDYPDAGGRCEVAAGELF